MKVQVALRPEAPERYRRVLAGLPLLELREGTRDRIGVDETLRPLILLPRPEAGTDNATAQAQRGQVPEGAVGLVVARSIPQSERDRIEEAGLSWCDGRGALHLAWPGTLIHVEQRSRPRPVRTTTEGLGPAGIRAVQVLLAAWDEPWTVTRLATAAGVSVGQAHNVFKAMEGERLVVTIGRGPQQRRELGDYRAALDWLSGLDQARRRPESASTFLYARTPDEVLRRFHERAAEVGLVYAVTGAAACQLLDVPVLNKIIVTQVRVSVLAAGAALDRLGLERLEADEAGRGANLELWTDTGELGTFGATAVRGIRVAPAVRVWLDLARQRGRNADAAQLFREQVLERA